MDDTSLEEDPDFVRSLESALRAACAAQPGEPPQVRPSSAFGHHVEGDLPRERSSYRVLEEIARGGMGVVLRGRDPELARDVALKVLREDIARRPSAVERFLAEARIVGQLQHPGIVPIYEYGRMADDRPYFAMKLIQGQTLAALMASRKSLEEQRHRFITIFEAICQTMAYAHARRVVHRDLKPANVMVGSFGEVQIVDWGLAKLLSEREAPRTADSLAPAGSAPAGTEALEGAAHSVAGTVMGTPAYMPPEQARGEVERVDERSDVFSLGGILCEILTGAPPYDLDSRAAKAAAVAAALDHARQRLGAVQGETELAALCARCLSPEPDERPRDAGVLVRSIQAYRASTEDRTRAAQIAAAEARVEAKAGRKALLLTAGLAGSVLLSVLIGGSAWYSAQNKEAVRRAHTANGVNAALERANLLAGRAESSDDLESWQGAQDEVERARTLLEAGLTTEDLTARVRELDRHVRAGLESARSRSELKAANQSLIARLQELRSPAVDGADATDWARVDQDFASAFREHGLDLGALSAADAAREMRRRGLGVELAIALDEWAAARRRVGDESGAERLVQAAVAVDPDPSRERLRWLLHGGQPAELAQFAASEDLEHLPVETLSLLGHSLSACGFDSQALGALRVAHRRRPEDYVTNVYLARLLWDRDYQESARYYTAALAVRPDDVLVTREFGYLLQHYLLDAPSAIKLYRRALARNPESATIHLLLGHALRAMGDFDAALAAYEQVLRMQPLREAAHVGRLKCRAEQGEHALMVGLAREMIREFPGSYAGYANLGRALVELGAWSEAIESLSTANQLEQGNSDILEDLRRSHEALGDPRSALHAAQELIGLAPRYLLVYRDQGLWLPHIVDLETSVLQRREAIRKSPVSPTQHALLAVLLEEQGRYGEASFELRTALALATGESAWSSPAENSLEAALLFVQDQARGWADDLERRSELEQRFELVVRGVEEPQAPAEWAEFARLARRRGRWPDAARLFARAFAEGYGPQDAGSDSARFEAAVAAVAMGRAHQANASPMDAGEHAPWRERALAWMGEDLMLRAAQVESEDTAERLRAARALGQWCLDPGLADVREDEATTALPADERAAWRELWGQVADLQSRLRDKAGARAR